MYVTFIQEMKQNVDIWTKEHEQLEASEQASVDWNDLGLQHLLQDDDYLDSLQSGVSAWIAQIRKLTVLPKSTTFSLLDQLLWTTMRTTTPWPI